MDLSITIAIVSLFVAIIALLHAFGVFRKAYSSFQERKVKQKIKVGFSPPEGKIKWEDGNGLINIRVVLINNLPHKAFRKVQGKFWTNEEIYVSSTNIPPMKVAASVPYLYFNFDFDILHKKTSAMLSTLTLRVPRKKGDYILGADVIAEELEDWEHFGYPLKIENDRFRIHHK